MSHSHLTLEERIRIELFVSMGMNILPLISKRLFLLFLHFQRAVNPRGGRHAAASCP